MATHDDARVADLLARHGDGGSRDLFRRLTALGTAGNGGTDRVDRRLMS